MCTEYNVYIYYNIAVDKYYVILKTECEAMSRVQAMTPSLLIKPTKNRDISEKVHEKRVWRLLKGEPQLKFDFVFGDVASVFGKSGAEK